MPIEITEVTEADGALAVIETDTVTGDVIRRVLRDFIQQPTAIRRRDEARIAVNDWFLLREFRAELVAGGLAYWDAIAPDAGLPTGSAAYNTALSFLLTRRDKAMSRAAAALDRWRTA